MLSIYCSFSDRSPIWHTHPRACTHTQCTPTCPFVVSYKHTSNLLLCCYKCNRCICHFNPILHFHPHFLSSPLPRVLGGTGRIEAENLNCQKHEGCIYTPPSANCTHSQDLVLQCSKLEKYCAFIYARTHTYVYSMHNVVYVVAHTPLHSHTYMHFEYLMHGCPLLLPTQAACTPFPSILLFRFSAGLQPSVCLPVGAIVGCVVAGFFFCVLVPVLTCIGCCVCACFGLACFGRKSPNYRKMWLCTPLRSITQLALYTW